MLNSANCRWEFSEECLADAWILQRICSPVHYPTSLPSPSQKKYQLLSFTESQAALCDVIYLLPYFSHWISAFKCKTSDVVIFEQITRSTPSELMAS